MRSSGAARRYSKALFALAQETGDIDQDLDITRGMFQIHNEVCAAGEGARSLSMFIEQSYGCSGGFRNNVIECLQGLGCL